MKDKALQTIRAHALLQPGDRVIAAVSGGADSMALLFLLNVLRAEFPLTLAAVHVNHGIRGAEAQRDADFVADACRALGVPCTVRTVSVPAMAAAEKCGLEECARRAGFGDPKNFATVMKRETGRPPSAWRQSKSKSQ